MDIHLLPNSWESLMFKTRKIRNKNWSLRKPAFEDKYRKLVVLDPYKKYKLFKWSNGSCKNIANWLLPAIAANLIKNLKNFKYSLTESQYFPISHQIVPLRLPNNIYFLWKIIPSATVAKWKAKLFWCIFRPSKSSFCRTSFLR